MKIQDFPDCYILIVISGFRAEGAKIFGIVIYWKDCYIKSGDLPNCYILIVISAQSKSTAMV